MSEFYQIILRTLGSEDQKMTADMLACVLSGNQAGAARAAYRIELVRQLDTQVRQIYKRLIDNG